MAKYDSHVVDKKFDYDKVYFMVGVKGLGLTIAWNEKPGGNVYTLCHYPNGTPGEVCEYTPEECMVSISGKEKIVGNIEINAVEALAELVNLDGRTKAS